MIDYEAISKKPKLIHSSISKKLEDTERCKKLYQNTNNNNRKSIKFINVISSDTLSYKKNICLLIDSKKSQNFCMPNEIDEYYKATKNINQIQHMNENKINKLFKGLPTVNKILDSSFNNIDDAQASPENNRFTSEYFFYSYFYPSEVDEGLLPFIEHFDKQDRALNNPEDDVSQTNDVMTEYGGDRRLKSVENKCSVKIKIGNLEEKLIRGLPRRKVTILAMKEEHIATALSCLEDSVPELFENALFIKPLECKTQKWPNKKGLLVRHVKRSAHFHRRALNCPLMSSIWFKPIDPRRIFPFGNVSQKRMDNMNRSNEYDTVYPTNSDDDVHDIITEQTAKVPTTSTEILSKPLTEKLSENNNNNNHHKIEQSVKNYKDFSKYLKFPWSKKSNHLFQCNIDGEPTDPKFKEYIKMCKCFVDNIKCRVDKFGIVYNIVKIRYQDPSQLVKLFLLLNYKIKY